MRASLAAFRFAPCSCRAPLRDTPVRIDGRDRRLLDEVDIISAVSGGSFTAAYYGLFGESTTTAAAAAYLMRYTVTGFWAAWGAPWLFTRFTWGRGLLLRSTADG